MPSDLEIDLAYIAGYFDGEGNIKHDSSQQKSGTSWGVSITNTVPDVIYKLESMFGGRVRVIENGGYKFKLRPWKFKTLYRWVAYGADARRFLILILPYLRHPDKIANAQMCIWVDEERDALGKGRSIRGLIDLGVKSHIDGKRNPEYYRRYSKRKRLNAKQKTEIRWSVG